MIDLYDGIAFVLGIGADGAELGPLQLTARAVTLYLVTLVLIRLGRSRYVGRNLAFDVVLGFILGSLLTRAINGSDTLFQTVMATGVMLGVHAVVRLLSAPEVQPLEMSPTASSDTALTRTDQSATLLYTGGVNVLERPALQPGETRILEVQVADGVQTVRIALG